MTIFYILLGYTCMGIYFEYQNAKEDKEEHKRKSS